MNQMSRLKRWIGDVRRYLKTHIWIEIFISVSLVSAFILFMLYYYLQNQYYQRMISDIGKSESVVSAASANSLNKIIDNQLYMGGEIALNDQLYGLTDAIVRSGGNSPSESRRLRNELSDITHFSEDIAAVSIVTAEGLLCEYGRYWDANGTAQLWSGGNLAIAKEMYARVKERLNNRGTGYYYVSTEPARRTAPPEMNLYHIAFPLIGAQSDLERVEAAVVISYNIEDIARTSALTGASDGDRTYRYLVGEDNTILYHERTDYIGMKEERYLSGWSVSAVSQPLDHFGWRVAVSLDKAQVRRDVSRIFARSSSVYGLAILLAILVWALLLRRMLRPLASVREAMEAAERGAPRKIEIQGEHEIWALASEYNEMMDALEAQSAIIRQEYNEKIRLEELRNRAERFALESQINAHFIFNTLNAINYNVMEAGNHESARLIKQLSNILQYTLSQNVEVTLGREFDIALQYLSLQKYRLMDKFDYAVDFPEEYSEWPCCKLFLQPFIENAIAHGFAGMETGGRIEIAGREESGRFRVWIADNGCGMTPEVRERVRESLESVSALETGRVKGIGIRNVITRMRMFFGPAFEAKLESAPGEGTRFTFWLPIPGMADDSEEEQ